MRNQNNFGRMPFFLVRPSFFNFLIYEKIFKILESGGRNKIKDKIPKIVQLIKK